MHLLKLFQIRDAARALFIAIAETGCEYTKTGNMKVHSGQKNILKIVLIGSRFKSQRINEQQWGRHLKKDEDQATHPTHRNHTIIFAFFCLIILKIS